MMLCGHVISSKFVGIAMMALMLPSSTHSFMQRRTPTAAALASSSSLWKTARPTTEVEAEDDNNSNQSTPQNRREVFQSIPGRVAAFSAIAATAGGITVPATAAAAAAASPTTATATTTTTTAAPTFSYGPLEEFVGTWKGSNGFVMIAVPSPGTEPTDRGDFFIKKFGYRETFTIEKVGDNVLQVGGSLDQFSAVLKYQKTVWATDTGDGTPVKEKDQAIIHEEEGMFFYLPNIVNVNKNGDASSPIDTKDRAPYALGRSAVVPHGNTCMMFGDVKEADQTGAPKIPVISTLPRADTPIINPFYFVPYVGKSDDPEDDTTINKAPRKALQDALNKTPVKTYNHIAMTTDQPKAGGILNTNFITKRADTRTYKADFWMETLENGKMQMQYSEVADIFFHFEKSLFGLRKSEIEWPHVMVNTLTKVA